MGRFSMQTEMNHTTSKKMYQRIDQILSRLDRKRNACPCSCLMYVFQCIILYIMELSPSIPLCILPYSWLRVCAAHSATSFRLHCALLQFGTMGLQKQWRSAPVQREKGRRCQERPFFLDTEANFMLPTVVRNASQVQGLNRRNCRTKPATCNANAERKSKDSPWQSFLIDRICQGRICNSHTKIRCYGKDRDYKMNSNKSKGKVKLLTSSELHAIIWMGTWSAYACMLPNDVSTLSSHTLALPNRRRVAVVEALS